MNSVFFLVLRRMRAPLILLIVFYAISVLGLTLIPGANEDGTPAPPLSFFHAFYFVSYTATTIGFGEIPRAFSDGQRLWVTVCIYLTVISWSYSILTLLALVQDKAFQNTLTSSRFARRVARIHTPFYVICGCGETGSLICRALDILGLDFVILEKDNQRVEELELEDFITNDPALAADASITSNLLLAGLRHRKCRGVLAVTNDENANLAIAINVRLLNPAIPVLARVRSPLIADNMASFGTDHIVNAYERFAQYLGLAVASPERFRLIEVLTGLPGTPIPEVHRPPRGHWIICGYGTFGRAIERCLDLPGIQLTFIDPRATGPGCERVVRGTGTEASVLESAGIRQASGIVAGSDDDLKNLAIAMMAKRLNPGIFVVTRRNHAASDVLFDTFDADFSMVHTRVVAQECISVLTTPLLAQFLAAVRLSDADWSRELTVRLESFCGNVVPEVWGTVIDTEGAPAVCKALQKGRHLAIGQLVRDNADAERELPLIVLMLIRGEHRRLLPDPDCELQPGDALLFAGRHEARSIMNLTMQNANALEYILTRHDERKSPG
ncbi:potassium channel family protein [Noviherbaspirillum malthae]|uniref:potassium channel family protein n=1 Tax=Noviherbaspirillum malthae TaxID=1260987 RepID=UPI00188EDDFC|nr:potassium channel protein [Noviherbaspirillum malthae]